jgi:hypothetical protein
VWILRYAKVIAVVGVLMVISGLAYAAGNLIEYVEDDAHNERAEPKG